MASLGMAALGVTAGTRVFAATAAAKSGGSDEKGFLDWILGGMQKDDQLLETDPILQKVEGKNGRSGTTSRKGSTSVTVPAGKKKNGGFGGLFAKKD